MLIGIERPDIYIVIIFWELPKLYQSISTVWFMLDVELYLRDNPPLGIS